MPTDVIELSRLSAAQKLRLIESIWDEPSSDSSAVPVEDWHKAELDRREADAATSPDAGSPWPEVRARINSSAD